MSGFVSGLASIGIDKVGVGQGQLGIAERTVLSAAVGGTAAELGGGKFANGAITAAFLRLYNEESSPRTDPSKLGRYKGKYNLAEALKQLEGVAPGTTIKDVASGDVIAALQKALDQGLIRQADDSWERFLTEGNSPAAQQGGYIIISDRVKAPYSWFPKFLAHEGLHLADFFAGRYQGRSDALTVAREMRAYNTQHAFAGRLGIPDVAMSVQDINRLYIQQGY